MCILDLNANPDMPVMYARPPSSINGMHYRGACREVPRYPDEDLRSYRQSPPTVLLLSGRVQMLVSLRSDLGSQLALRGRFGEKHRRPRMIGR